MIVNRLDLLLRTLNRIEVCGKENMYRLLGCIEELEKMKGEMSRDDHDQRREDVQG